MKTNILSALLMAALTSTLALAQAPKNLEVTIDGVKGFQDTPLQPNGKWHVHDPARPQPVVVTPGASFSQQAAAPSDATVLFDGKDLSAWRDQNTGGEAQWKIEAGVMTCAKGDIRTVQKFGDVQLHLEFREPTPAAGEGQGRGNSGIYFMDNYEIQILDNYQSKSYADGSIGGIYGQHPALANACKPPGEWQTYDIIFTAPRFDAGGKVVSPAYATVVLNGVVVQNHQAFRGATNWKSPGKYSAHADMLPLTLQWHKNPVAFRNIWVRNVPQNNEP